MDCKLARTRLDAARPDVRDREDAELLAAFAHVDECAACAEAVEFRRTFDRRLGTVIRAIDVPADLQSRLLTSLTAAAPEARPDEAGTHRRSRRRSFLAASSAAALLIAAGSMWWAGQRQPAPLTADTVLDWCRTNLVQGNGDAVAALAEFDGEFDAAIGDGRWASRMADSPPRGADLDGDGRHDAAVYSFPGGYLVVLPPDRVTDPPAGNAPPYYTPAPHVAWTFNRQMYVCILPAGNSGQLDALLRQVYGSAA